MLKDNRNYNAQVTSNTALLKTLRDKLPEFFMADKIDEDGSIISQGTFDFEKFKKALAENSIQTELTSGYQLNFIGKDYAKKQAGEAPTTVVLPDKVHNEQKENKNSKNLFFTGDNLEVLRHLQASYENSIDVIYIDPPYNTGSDGFVYPDKFEYSDDKLQAMFGMNDEELERLKSIQGKATHSAWLTFMYPRLWLAKRLLKETGVIFVSIDDNEQANLKLLMDEIFGEGQFITKFIWEKTQHFGRQKINYYSNADYIFAYSKQSVINDKLNEILVEYQKEEFEDAPLYNNSNNENILEFPSGSVQFKIADGEYTHSTDEKYLLVDTVSVENGWNKNKFRMQFKSRWSNQTIQEEVQKGTTFLVKSEKFAVRAIYAEGKQALESPRQIIFTQQSMQNATKSRFGQRIDTSENATNYLNNLIGGEFFSYPKPVSLIKYFISLLIKDGVYKDDITILDFFAGSATTAEAVMQLNAEDGGNRQFIMVQLPEPTFTQNSDGTKVARKGSESAFKAGYQSIDEISRDRIKRASKKIQEEKGAELPERFDGGFKHYRVLEPTQATLNDLDSFDIESGDFLDNNGNSLLFKESDFDDMISPFSSKGLGFEDGAAGEETILSTWLLADGYSLLSSGEKLDLAGYEASYVNSERLYLIAEGWSSEQTKELVNIIGKNEKVIPTIVLYGYSFEMESMRELELALDQLDTKVNLVKRY
ncbi:site-specific DNA-methyltransferase [Streptococcus ruminicola]|uniref:Site-specific DNA-methyltransferase n=1 Tax=Streptococcus ruminicola TaxID=2686210 RepID=A0AAE6UYH6_9STRE|nr:site-specific DNA-methyltransferase [Streptococcus ruminicola]QGZ27376.1 site-specific DNA-methyltransferase [Streptococcus ruminicola]